MAEAKKGRRDYGDGSIYQRQSDGRYVGSLRLSDGTRKSVYGTTRQEARRKLEQAKREAEHGALVASTKQRLADYLEYWLPVKASTIKKSTAYQYRTNVYGRILPALGQVPLQKLTTRHVQGFITGLVEDGLSASFIRSIHAMLSMALEQACTWQFIAVNPCKGVLLPRRDSEDEAIHALDASQAQALLAQAKGHPLEALVTLALSTGMRRGELLALKWVDLDFDQRTVRITSALTRSVGEGYRITTPKTQGSKRTVPLVSFAVAALRTHRTRQKEARLAAGAAAWQEKGLVFCDARGDYLTYYAVEAGYKHLLQGAGLPAIHFHDLRHSCATLLIAQGTPLKVVQEILGHSTAYMTMRYLHALPVMNQQAMTGLETLLSPAPQQTAL